MTAPYSGPGFVRYRGRNILQSHKISLDFETGNNDVNTSLLGRAGHSPGAKKVVVRVESAVPQGGLEVDWVGIADAQGVVPLDFVFANRTYACEGDIRSVNLSHEVSNPNAVSWELHGINTSRT
jgi:hypothetical protein